MMKYGGYKASLSDDFPLVFIIWQHTLFTPFLVTSLKLYKSFLDSTCIFMDLDSAENLSGYAKLRISCLPVYAILFNAISLTSSLAFCFLLYCWFSTHETLYTKFEFSVILGATLDAGLHKNGVGGDWEGLLSHLARCVYYQHACLGITELCWCSYCFTSNSVLGYNCKVNGNEQTREYKRLWPWIN